MKIRTVEEKYDGIPNPFKRDVDWPIYYSDLNMEQQKLVSFMYDFEEQRQIVERMKEEITSISSDLNFVSKELQRICFDD